MRSAGHSRERAAAHKPHARPVADRPVRNIRSIQCLYIAIFRRQYKGSPQVSLQPPGYAARSNTESPARPGLRGPAEAGAGVVTPARAFRIRRRPCRCMTLPRARCVLRSTRGSSTALTVPPRSYQTGAGVHPALSCRRRRSGCIGSRLPKSEDVPPSSARLSRWVPRLHVRPVSHAPRVLPRNGYSPPAEPMHYLPVSQ